MRNKLYLLIILFNFINSLFSFPTEIHSFQFYQYLDANINSVDHTFLENNGYRNAGRVYGIGTNLEVKFYETQNDIDPNINPEISDITYSLLESACYSWRNVMPELIVMSDYSGNSENSFPVKYSEDSEIFWDEDLLQSFGFVSSGGVKEDVYNNSVFQYTKHRTYYQSCTITDFDLSTVYINVSPQFYYYNYDFLNSEYRNQTWTELSFDQFDIATNTFRISLKKVLKHEIGHILGFGHILLDENDPLECVMRPGVLNQPDSDSWSILDFTLINLLYPVGSSSVDDYTTQSINNTITSYPNPAKNQVNFEIKSCKLSNNQEISIYNIKGQKVKTIPLSKTEDKMTWDLKSNDNQKVSSGIYFVILKENGITISKKKIMVLK